MNFYIADMHFGHKNILTYDNRPFSTTQEMDRALITNWNDVVTDNDTVYVLGDIFWIAEDAENIIKRLKGKKVLIIGNHDKIGVYVKANRFVEITQYKELEMDNTGVILTHFPLAEWDGFYYGTYHLYGHTHSTFNLAEFTLQRERPNGNCWDVGVDNNNFEPVSFEEIKEKIDKNIKDITDGKNI